MKLSDKTRKTVENILEQIKKKLTENTSESELMHHGVPGQKWGVKNGPPYPIDRSRKNDTIVKDAIASGEVSKTINPDKQKRHTKEGHSPGRSYIDGDVEYAQELVDELSGTGEALLDSNGKWTHKEHVEASHVIGTHVNPVTGEESLQNEGVIVYSKTGSHIYPAKKEE